MLQMWDKEEAWMRKNLTFTDEEIEESRHQQIEMLKQFLEDLDKQEAELKEEHEHMKQLPEWIAYDTELSAIIDKMERE